MQTYRILVEKTTKHEILVRANSLEEAKSEALRQHDTENGSGDGPNFTTSAICLGFYPYERVF